MKSKFSTYRNLAFAVVASASLSSCALEVVNPPVNAQLMVVNATPVASSATVGVAPLQINANGTNMLYDSLRNNAISGYISFPASTNSIKLTARNNNTRFSITQGKEYASFSYNGVLGEYTSAFLLPDATTNDRFTVVSAKDDLTVPAANTAKVRFVHGIPGAPDVDVWISAGPAGADLTKPVVSGLKFKDVSAFVTLPSVPTATPRTNYTFVLRPAGSAATVAPISTIAATATVTTNASTTPHILENGRIMTVVITGTGTRLSVLNDR
jgi:hypothetical protein